MLTKHKDKLTTLAERLLDKEVIFKEDLEKIFGKRPFDKEFDKLGQEKIDKKKESAAKPTEEEALENEAKENKI